MTDLMIWYTPVDRFGNSLPEETVMISRIVRLSKGSERLDHTIIHLDTGDKLCSADSMKTLCARINATGETESKLT